MLWIQHNSPLAEFLQVQCPPGYLCTAVSAHQSIRPVWTSNVLKQRTNSSMMKQKFLTVWIHNNGYINNEEYLNLLFQACQFSLMIFFSVVKLLFTFPQESKNISRRNHIVVNLCVVLHYINLEQSLTCWAMLIL